MKWIKVEQRNIADFEYRLRKGEQVSCESEVEGSEKIQ